MASLVRCCDLFLIHPDFKAAEDTIEVLREYQASGHRDGGSVLKKSVPGVVGRRKNGVWRFFVPDVQASKRKEPMRELANSCTDALKLSGSMPETTARAAELQAPCG
jgi:hypothetical protein